MGIQEELHYNDEELSLLVPDWALQQNKMDHLSEKDFEFFGFYTVLVIEQHYSNQQYQVWSITVPFLRHQQLKMLKDKMLKSLRG